MYLETLVEDTLKWDLNTEAITKKGHQRLPLLRKLRSFNVDPAILKLFYKSVSKCSLYTFYNNPAPLNGSMQFHYCTDSNPGTGADDAFVLKRGVWRNATWPHGLHTADRR